MLCASQELHFFTPPQKDDIDTHSSCLLKSKIIIEYVSSVYLGIDLLVIVHTLGY